MALLPSDVHRLVLGFLMEDAQCTQAALQFLNESPLLQEVAQLLHNKNSQSVSILRVGGKTLKTILDETVRISSLINSTFAIVKSAGEAGDANASQSLDTHEADTGLRKLKAISDFVQKTIEKREKSQDITEVQTKNSPDITSHAAQVVQSQCPTQFVRFSNKKSGQGAQRQRNKPRRIVRRDLNHSGESSSSSNVNPSISSALSTIASDAVGQGGEKRGEVEKSREEEDSNSCLPEINAQDLHRNSSQDKICNNFALPLESTVINPSMPLTSTISISSPLKSRKSALKARVPTKHSENQGRFKQAHNEPNDIELVKRKLGAFVMTSDDQKLTAVAEPLVQGLLQTVPESQEGIPLSIPNQDFINDELLTKLEEILESASKDITEKWSEKSEKDVSHSNDLSIVCESVTTPPATPSLLTPTKCNSESITDNIQNSSENISTSRSKSDLPEKLSQSKGGDTTVPNGEPTVASIASLMSAVRQIQMQPTVPLESLGEATNNHCDQNVESNQIPSEKTLVRKGLTMNEKLNKLSLPDGTEGEEEREKQMRYVEGETSERKKEMESTLEKKVDDFVEESTPDNEGPEMVCFQSSCVEVVAEQEDSLVTEKADTVIQAEKSPQSQGNSGKVSQRKRRRSPDFSHLIETKKFLKTKPNSVSKAQSKPALNSSNAPTTRSKSKKLQENKISAKAEKNFKLSFSSCYRSEQRRENMHDQPAYEVSNKSTFLSVLSAMAKQRLECKKVIEDQSVLLCFQGEQGELLYQNEKGELIPLENIVISNSDGTEEFSIDISSQKPLLSSQGNNIQISSEPDPTNQASSGSQSSQSDNQPNQPSRKSDSPVTYHLLTLSPKSKETKTPSPQFTNVQSKASTKIDLKAKLSPEKNQQRESPQKRHVICALTPTKWSGSGQSPSKVFISKSLSEFVHVGSGFSPFKFGTPQKSDSHVLNASGDFLPNRASPVSSMKSLSTPVNNLDAHSESPGLQRQQQKTPDRPCCSQETQASGARYFTPTTPNSVKKHKEVELTPGLRFLREEGERISNGEITSCSEDSMSPSRFKAKMETNAKSSLKRQRNPSGVRKLTPSMARKNIGIEIEASIQNQFGLVESPSKSKPGTSGLSKKQISISSPLKASQTVPKSPLKQKSQALNRVVGSLSPAPKCTKSPSKNSTPIYDGVFKTPKKIPYRSPVKKQVRKRATLIKVIDRSPLRNPMQSSWEAKHDINNLDNYRKNPPDPNPCSPYSTSSESSPLKVSSVSQKRKQEESHSSQNSKALKAFNEVETIGAIFQSSTIDVNMEITSQLSKTPEKMSPSKCVSSSNSSDLHSALGLVRRCSSRSSPPRRCSDEALKKKGLEVKTDDANHIIWLSTVSKRSLTLTRVPPESSFVKSSTNNPTR